MSGLMSRTAASQRVAGGRLWNATEAGFGPNQAAFLQRPMTASSPFLKLLRISPNFGYPERTCYELKGGSLYAT
jgi:hypothetical protein